MWPPRELVWRSQWRSGRVAALQCQRPGWTTWVASRSSRLLYLQSLIILSGLKEVPDHQLLENCWCTCTAKGKLCHLTVWLYYYRPLSVKWAYISLNCRCCLAIVPYPPYLDNKSLRCGIAEHPRGTGKAHLPYNHCNAARVLGQHVFFASVCSCSNLAGVCSHGFLQMPYLLYKNVKLPHYCEHFEEQGILFLMTE